MSQKQNLMLSRKHFPMRRLLFENPNSTKQSDHNLDRRGCRPWPRTRRFRSTQNPLPLVTTLIRARLVDDNLSLGLFYDIYRTICGEEMNNSTVLYVCEKCGFH